MWLQSIGPEAWLTLAVILSVLAGLALTRLSPDLVLIGGLMVLVAAGVVDESEALSGLSNTGMITVGALFVVTSGLRETGAVARLSGWLFGRDSRVRAALTRMVVPVVLTSALLNNTPIVAALLPTARDWARKAGVAPSKMLLPLSYAAILGGTLTLIGTSTNLVVAGMVEDMLPEHPGLVPIGMFDITPLGIAVAACGGLLLVVLAPWLLPARQAVLGIDRDPREYTVELQVAPGGPVDGRTIEEAGLRHLPGSYIIEIDRGDTVLPAVDPGVRLQGGDRLVFAGLVESVVDLQRTAGLLPAPDQVFKLDGPREQRNLVEAVVSQTHPLLGRTIRGGRFRNVYGAVVVAAARHGARIQGKLGDVTLQAGDALLLEAPPGWVKRHRNRRDFYLVSAVADSTPPRHHKAPLALLVLVLMVLAAATELMGMLQAALLASAALLLTRCTSVAEARRAIDWPVLLAIAAALGIGRAMHSSGLDTALADIVLRVGADTPWQALLAVYVVTVLVTEVVTNNAAAALVLPLGVSVADRLGVNPMPYVFAVMMGGSASFLTPIGYQTNLMVYGPGGYRFSDYLRLGLPLAVACGALTVGLAPLIWPF